MKIPARVICLSAAGAAFGHFFAFSPGSTTFAIVSGPRIRP
jgi:hypothetical protein